MVRASQQLHSKRERPEAVQPCGSFAVHRTRSASAAVDRVACECSSLAAFPCADSALGSMAAGAH